MSISTIERPLTQREREIIEPPGWNEVADAIGKASSSFDDGELGDVCAMGFEVIAELIAQKDAEAIGKYIMFLRRQRIADLASRAMYGRPGEISASQVLV